MPDSRSVLVTRPAGQEKALCASLAAAGYEPHYQPLLELEPWTDPGPASRRRLQELDQFRHIIFISGNAVRFGMARIREYWPQLPADLNWYAIGTATAARLADYAIPVSAPLDEMTTESLLALPPLQAVAGQRVLIVKGVGGRETLHQELTRRGARVEELPCYRRRCPQLPAGELATRLTRWQVGTILLSSGEALDNMLRLLSPEETLNVRTLNLLVPSRRVALQAEAAGFTRVITAQNASDAAVIRALEEYAPAVEKNV
jgi:uroporphyrinogen-III synthase